MNYITAVGVGLLIFAGVALAQTKKNTDDLETKNLTNVRAWIRSCEKSGCKECGMFSYMSTNEGQQVLYSPTLCEMNWSMAQQELDAKRIDKEIREKYGQ